MTKSDIENIILRLEGLEAQLKLTQSMLEVHQKALEIQANINNTLILKYTRSSEVLKSTGLGQKKVSRSPGDREH